MAYNYLEITNALLRSLNEVELNSANFLTSKGFYAHARDAVNNALRDINMNLIVSFFRLAVPFVSNVPLK